MQKMQKGTFGKNDGVDGLAARMELSTLADDIVPDSDEIDEEIAQICLSLTDDDLRGVLSAEIYLMNLAVQGRNFCSVSMRRTFIREVTIQSRRY